MKGKNHVYFDVVTVSDWFSGQCDNGGDNFGTLPSKHSNPYNIHIMYI